MIISRFSGFHQLLIRDVTSYILGLSVGWWGFPQGAFEKWSLEATVGEEQVLSRVNNLNQLPAFASWFVVF